MKYEKLSPYKRKKLQGITINVAVVIVSYLLLELEWLSILPVFSLVAGTLMAGAHAMYFFFNYDEEQESAENIIQNSIYITSNRKRPKDGHENRHD